MRLGDLFYLNRHDRRSLLVLLSIAVIAFALMLLAGGDEPNEAHEAHEAFGAYEPHTPYKPHTPHPSYASSLPSPERFAFDPNSADSTQLLRLGLQPWQVRNIYKYRAAGGIYRRKEDFARLYGLTVKQYRELEPYIYISADYLPASTLVKDEKPDFQRDTLRFPVKIAEGETVNLNAADTAIYKKVPGIGSYYARRIADYSQRLGGFVSVDQLDEIENFPQEAKSYFTIGSAQVRQLNVNSLSLNELKRHPYINYYRAKAITDYRRLHGPLRSLDDLRLLPDFSEEVINRLKPYVCF